MNVRFLFCALALCACGSSSPGTAGSTDASTADAAQASDGSVHAEEWTTLIEGDWSLGPGSEGYECVALTLAQDVYIKAISPVAPLGTHHTVVTTVPPSFNVEDGQFPCDGFTVGPHMIYGSGVGTESLVFPEGVALHLRAGQQILLNLHLFNFDAGAGLSGYSAIRVQTMQPDDMVDEAEIVLAGKDQGLFVPARQTSSQTGACSFGRAQKIFAIFPHMHTTGVHMRVTATRAGEGDVDLMDDDYDFDRQIYSMLSPEIAMAAGDSLSITCTYDNPGEAKTFGESTGDEMCYAGVYRYPASNASGTTCTR